MVQLKEKTIRMKENFDGYIRKKPEKSVLIAAGIGTIAGAMLALVLMKRH